MASNFAADDELAAPGASDASGTVVTPDDDDEDDDGDDDDDEDEDDGDDDEDEDDLGLLGPYRIWDLSHWPM